MVSKDELTTFLADAICEWIISFNELPECVLVKPRLYSLLNPDWTLDHKLFFNDVEIKPSSVIETIFLIQ